MGIKFKFEEVKLLIRNIGYELINDFYLHNKQKLTVVDSLGYYYFTTLFDLKSGNSPLAFYIKNPYTIQNLKLWCKLNNKNFELVSDLYEGNDKKLKWKCLVKDCGELFEASWSNIQSHWGCSYCAGKKVALSNCLATKNPKLASEWHPTKNGDLTPYDFVCGNKSKVWWKCKNEHEWDSTIHNRNYHESECPYCVGHLPSDDNNLLVCNPILCEEWDYNKNVKLPKEYLPNSNLYVWWICKECNHSWQSTIINRNFSDSGCPCCNSSKGEKLIELFLKSLNIYYLPQYRFKDCKNKIALPFDFYLPDFNLCIEYQGLQHFEPVKHFGGENGFRLRKINDNIKKEYCNIHNIKFLEIEYWNYKNIENIILNILKKVS